MMIINISIIIIIIKVPFKSLCVHIYSILFCMSLLWLTVYKEHVLGMKILFRCFCVLWCDSDVNLNTVKERVQ